MVDYASLRKKFPVKDPARRKKAAAMRAIAREYEAKRAELGAAPPGARRGFPYYMTVVIGMLLLGGLVGTAIFKRGGIDVARKNRDKAVTSIRNLAIAAGRYRYHTGRFPSTEEGLEQLASKRVVARGWNGPYVKKINKDPWGGEYVYVCNGESEPPTLYSKGPDGLAGTTDDVMADPADFDLAFRDTEWTREWVPQHLRDIVVAQDEKHKRALQAEVDAILHPKAPVEGARTLPRDEWTRDGGSEFFRTSMTLPKEAVGKYIALRFGGASGPVEVLLNGERIGGCFKPFSPFDVDMTRKFRFEENNTVCIPECSFCREVQLVVENPDERIFPGSLKAETLSATERSATVRVIYLTPKGQVSSEFETPNPRLWSPERPSLYKGYIGTELYRYAIREIKVAEDGSVSLNGAPVALKCVVMPPDADYAGATVFDAGAVARRLKALKDMGANAVRPTAQPGAGFRDLCDEMGFFVLDGDLAAAETPDAVKMDEVLDPAGTERDAYWIRRAEWSAEDSVKILTDAKSRPVRVAANGDEMEFFADGEPLGRHGTGTAPVWLWDAPEDAGELKAIAYRKGEYAGEDVVKRPMKPFSTRLAAEKKALAEGEATVVAVDVVDEYGVPDGTAEGVAEFALQGLGDIVAAGNRDGCSAVAGNTAKVPLSGGRAAIAVRRRPAGSGMPLKISVSVPGLRTDSLTVPRR